MPIIGRRHGDGYAEYPCVRRLRHRRLITLLLLQGFETTAESMVRESDAMFSVQRLRQLVAGDQWRDAQRYLSGFLLPLPDTAAKRPRPRPRPLSVQAMALRLFLGVHGALANILAGGKGSYSQYVNHAYSQYVNHDRTVCHGTIRLRSIILNILHCRHQVRFSIDWERVRLKAAEIVDDLAYRTPELKDLVHITVGLMRPHNVVPIGVRFHRRYPLKKRARKPRADTVAKLYLGKTRRLPAISDPSQESCNELEAEYKALDLVADLVDECLKAGKRPDSHLVGPLQTSGTEVLQTASSGLTNPAINPGMTTSVPNEVKNAGSKLASHVPANGAPFLGTVHTPVAQTGFGCLTNRCGNSDVGLMANSGATIAAPVSQSMACPAINPRMPSMEIGGKLVTHVPTTGALFWGTMGPPFSQVVTTHCDNSGIALLGKEGAPVGVSEIMNLTKHAGDSGAPVGVSEIMNLTKHAGDSGALVAPVSQSMFGTLTGPAKTVGMPLVANAGQSAGLVLAPSAPVSRTAVGCLTSTAQNSGLSLMTNNAGATVAPAMQTTNLASHAEISGALVPAVQTMNLANHAGNTSAPVAPALQTMDSASRAGNSGITKRFDKEDSNAESAYQGYIPREELSILDEPDLCPKRQQTTGAFSEASLTPTIET